MNQLLEEHIIELIKEKDERGMSLLYDRYADALYGVAYKIMRNEEMAQDVLQESLVKIWKKADTYDKEKARLFTWLFRIVRNTSLDKLRSMKIQDASIIQMEDSNVYTLSTQNFQPDELDIGTHLGKLDARYREVIDALFFLGMSQQEASKALGIPLGTVKSRLKIGMRELRHIYGTEVK